MLAHAPGRQQDVVNAVPAPEDVVDGKTLNGRWNVGAERWELLAHSEPAAGLVELDLRWETEVGVLVGVDVCAGVSLADSDAARSAHQHSLAAVEDHPAGDQQGIIEQLASDGGRVVEYGAPDIEVFEMLQDGQSRLTVDYTVTYLDGRVGRLTVHVHVF